MSITANTATVQILDDNAAHVIAKFQFFQHTANTTSHENSVLKINCNTLMGRTADLVFAAKPEYLWPGDTITQVSNTSITGKVAGWNGNTVVVVLANSQAMFANSEACVFTRPGGNTTSYTITATGATRTTPELTLRQASWSISGNSATRVALEWVGTPNTEIVAFSAGSGYFGKNNLSTAIPNDANSATGDVNISTYSTPALTGYTIIAEFAKTKGFAPAGH